MESQELLRGNLSSIHSNECVVVRNKDEWQTLWKRHGAVQFPPPSPPAVNFDKEMVLAVFLGERPSAGYSVEVRAIDWTEASEGTDSPGNLAVYAREKRPAEGSIQPQVLVTPFQMLLVPKVEGQVDLHMEL